MGMIGNWKKGMRFGTMEYLCNTCGLDSGTKYRHAPSPSATNEVQDEFYRSLVTNCPHEKNVRHAAG